jgi:hypothetical protein
VAVADLDGDGKPDLAVVSQMGNHFSVFRNITAGPGTLTAGAFDSRIDFVSGSNPNGIAVGDLNGDGKPDVVFGNDYSQNIYIYQNVIPQAKPAPRHHK